MYLDAKLLDIGYLSEKASRSSTYTWLESYGQISPGTLSKSLDTAAIAVGQFQERPNKRRNVVVVSLCEVCDGEAILRDECGLFMIARDCFNVNPRCNLRLPSSELARAEGLLVDFERYVLLLSD
jgi:hypothetical protein